MPQSLTYVQEMLCRCMLGCVHTRHAKDALEDRVIWKIIQHDKTRGKKVGNHYGDNGGHATTASTVQSNLIIDYDPGVDIFIIEDLSIF